MSSSKTTYLSVLIFIHYLMLSCSLLPSRQENQVTPLDNVIKSTKGRSDCKRRNNAIACSGFSTNKKVINLKCNEENRSDCDKERN